VPIDPGNVMHQIEVIGIYEAVEIERARHCVAKHEARSDRVVGFLAGVMVDPRSDGEIPIHNDVDLVTDSRLGTFRLSEIALTHVTQPPVER
jgi:hypothetical protein